MVTLRFIEGPNAGRNVGVPATGLLLGRAPDAECRVDDPQISGHHARMELRDGTWYIEDLDSSNGTLVNGLPVQSVALCPDDVITMGDSQCVFYDEPSEETEKPVAEPEPAEPKPQEAPPPEPRPELPDVSVTVPDFASEPPPQPVVEAAPQDVELVVRMRERTDAIRSEVAKVIVGQTEVVNQVLMCMIAGGHALLIGLPGMAKTLMVRTIARVLDMAFKRIQFTPDLMPTDITGTDVLEANRDTGEKEFRFIRGPIFCNLLLADEINRTPPKTQAALLEAMQEKRVTAGNTTYTLDEPFFVLATQNPIEQEGTYPLPEAQLDRFMFNIWIDYPDEHEEEQIVGSTTTGMPAEPACILKHEEVLQLQEVVRKVPVSPHVIKYAIRLVRATRPAVSDAPEVTKTYVSTGAGPRAGQYLVLAAKARAVLEGRIHVSCNDIRAAAVPVLRHRILTNFAADSEGMRPMDIVTGLLGEIQEPDASDYGG